METIKSGKFARGLVIAFVAGLILLMVIFWPDLRTRFFKTPGEMTAENATNPEATFMEASQEVVLEFRNGEQVLLSEFPDTTDFPDDPNSKKITYLDLNRDGKQELYLTWYTGGMHCCNESFLFTSVSPNHFREVFTFTGGSELSFEGDRIIADTYEQTAYFYTCYACQISDTLPRKDFFPHITLVYARDSVFLAPTDEVLNETITDNLAFLGNWTKTSSFMVGEDSGVRKSFAEHIITHHYNNGGDISRSRALFSRYYGAPDSLEVWDGITQHLKNIFGMDFAAEQYSKSIMELVGEIERLTKEDKE